MGVQFEIAVLSVPCETKETPRTRQKVPLLHREEAKNQSQEDSLITANNLKYFSEPAYEYTLIQAQEDGYLAACEIVKRCDWHDSQLAGGSPAIAL